MSIPRFTAVLIAAVSYQYLPSKNLASVSSYSQMSPLERKEEMRKLSEKLDKNIIQSTLSLIMEAVATASFFIAAGALLAPFAHNAPRWAPPVCLGTFCLAAPTALTLPIWPILLVKSMVHAGDLAYLKHFYSAVDAQVI